MSKFGSSGLCILTAFLSWASASTAQDPGTLKKAVTFYASFDEGTKADLGGGELTLSTRFNDPNEKDKFIFKKGYDANVFRISKNGIQGGALQPVDVLPDNGRVFFPAKGNIAYKPGGWQGAVSVWINTDPNKLLKTKFCDPVQITQRGALNGGIWFDFNDAKPRDMRMGLFPAVKVGQKALAESDPNAPMVRVPAVGFKQDDWHHIVLSFKNLDTGLNDAEAVLFIDGKIIGKLSDWDISMSWDIDKAGIYVAVNYIGLLDELALFDRALTRAEVELLHRQPGLIADLKQR